MAPRYALIKDSKIENIILCYPENIDLFHSSFLCIPISNLEINPGIGWSYINGVFTPPIEDE